jgi:hypothetical protein
MPLPIMRRQSAASARCLNEADPLDGYAVIEFVPIGCVGLDEQTSLHSGRITKLDFCCRMGSAIRRQAYSRHCFDGMPCGVMILWKWEPVGMTSFGQSYSSEYCATS